MKVNLNEIFEFDLTGKVGFGDMPIESLYELFKDGRVASKFLENIIPSWFPELTFVDQDGYDHINEVTNVKYDLKGFTRGGANYAPSTMIGAGRKINKEQMHAHAQTINYIFSDITEFPKVRIIFKTGTEMIEKFPTGKITKKQRNILFSE